MDQEASTRNMENRLAELEDKLKEVTSKLENVQRENEIHRRRSRASREYAGFNHVDRAKAESQSTGRSTHEDEKVKKMHHDTEPYGQVQGYGTKVRGVLFGRPTTHKHKPTI